MSEHHGYGILKVSGAPVGRCRFDLIDEPEAGLLVCRGQLTGDSRGLATAFDADNEVTLQREDSGYEMRVFLTDVSHDGYANVTVTGSPTA